MRLTLPRTTVLTGVVSALLTTSAAVAADSTPCERLAQNTPKHMAVQGWSEREIQQLFKKFKLGVVRNKVVRLEKSRDLGGHPSYQYIEVDNRQVKYPFKGTKSVAPDVVYEFFVRGLRFRSSKVRYSMDKLTFAQIESDSGSSRLPCWVTRELVEETLERIGFKLHLKDGRDGSELVYLRRSGSRTVELEWRPGYGELSTYNARQLKMLLKAAGIRSRSFKLNMYELLIQRQWIDDVAWR